jgi:peptidoglycan/xylan/chitin deacetylase (PgdA/CDA1 family)
MKPYFVKTPRVIQNIFSDYIWQIPTDNKEIYLTFDDGPVPEITPWVLHTLKKFNAHATFFCIGDNIKKNPKIFQQLIKENHSIGNHTYNHLSGWKTTNKAYLGTILKTEKIIHSSVPKAIGISNQKSKLFRPPYGRIKASQSKAIIKNQIKIIMWDVLSADFDQSISKEKCYQNVIKNTKKGGIIVFHDSEKAFKNLNYTLPKVLEYFTEKGYVFKSL